MTMFSFIGKALVFGSAARRIRRFLAEDTRGTAAVEFGILLPFMVVLLAGITDVGRSIWHQHTLQKGVQDAARYLSRVDVQADGSLTAAERARAKDIMLRGDFDGSKPWRFGYWSSGANVDTNLDTETGLVTDYDNTTPYSGTGLKFRGQDTIHIITVTAEVTAPSGEFPLLSLFNGGTVSYQARHQVRNFGE